MNSESYISRRASNMLQIGFIRDRGQFEFLSRAGFIASGMSTVERDCDEFRHVTLVGEHAVKFGSSQERTTG